MASLSLSSAHFSSTSSSSRSSISTSSLSPSSTSLPLLQSPIRRRYRSLRRRLSFSVIPRRTSRSFSTSNSQVLLLTYLVLFKLLIQSVSSNVLNFTQFMTNSESVDGELL